VRTRPGLDRPNLQLYIQAVTTVSARAGTRPLTTPDPFPGFSIGMSNCQVESRGSVTISRDDPFAPPRIRANALGTEGDVRNVIEGLAFLRRLAAQPALAGIIAEEVAPGPAVADAAAMLADFRARAGTVYHPCGTCRMGPEPATAVVDARLRAHGLAGLRIADASVFPALIVGNTNAPVMMVAARAAEMMLEDAREA
jgi:choline dehydrogenase